MSLNHGPKDYTPEFATLWVQKKNVKSDYLFYSENVEKCRKYPNSKNQKYQNQLWTGETRSLTLLPCL